MADTVLTSDSEKRLYQENLFISAENDSLWAKFTGSMDNPNAIVNVDNRPELDGGARADYAIRPYIKPSSVTNGPLDGQEIKLEFFYDNLTLDQHRQAVIDSGRKQAVKAFFSINDAQEKYIREWLTQMYDALHFKAVLSESGNPNLFYQGTATSEATLTATDTNEVDALTNLFTVAQTGKSRTFEPLRPYMYDGEEYYIYMCHPDEFSDIRKDIEPFWKDAQPRGDNPLFKRAKIVWNGIVVMTDRRMPIKLGGAAGTTPISTGVLLGEQAVQQIRGQDFNIVEGSKDWGNQNGYAAEFIVGCKAPEFNSSRFGSILVKSARTNISGSDNLAEINYTQISTSNQ